MLILVSSRRAAIVASLYKVYIPEGQLLPWLALAHPKDKSLSF